MPNIHVLDQSTINKIAAGEVIERPASVVKELLENAVDAKATAVTVEIRDGGISFIRVTDNGCGIPREELPLAFLRHSTSKIQSVEDLFTISSLGFRGEALSSIGAVSQVEVITKTAGSLTGTRYQIEGGLETGCEEIGSPDGTTFIVRNLFYNTPVRKKFLKTAATEGAHVADLVEKIALSHPEISIRFIQNNQNKLHTSGNHNVKDIIYTVFGREIAASLLPVDKAGEAVSVKGFIGKPVIARNNRNFENYFINGRYIKSGIICRAIEEAYKPYMMQHKYPFTLLHFTIEPEFLDVNVHPTKMELRFRDSELMFRMVRDALSQALDHRELIPQVELEEKSSFGALREGKRTLSGKPELSMGRASQRHEEAASPGRDAGFQPRSKDSVWSGARQIQPEFGLLKSKETKVSELRPLKQEGTRELEFGPLKQEEARKPGLRPLRQTETKEPELKNPEESVCVVKDERAAYGSTNSSSSDEKHREVNEELTALLLGSRETASPIDVQTEEKCEEEKQGQQMDLFEEKLLDEKSRSRHKLIGQLFDTYWLIEFNQSLYIIDQHAAHEKVLYEKTMATLKTRQYTCQMVNPPIILTLGSREQVMLQQNLRYFTDIGFEIEPFGGREFAVRGVPDNLFSIAKKDLLMEMIDGLSEDGMAGNPDMIYEKVASMSCKAAVKGNHHMSAAEADRLIDQLLELDNPYACPHGRPTIVSMTKYELEKKFKRIV
jgi:DNA mismatch repair protein MutL